MKTINTNNSLNSNLALFNLEHHKAGHLTHDVVNTLTGEVEFTGDVSEIWAWLKNYSF